MSALLLAAVGGLGGEAGVATEDERGRMREWGGRRQGKMGGQKNEEKDDENIHGHARSSSGGKRKA